MSVLVLLLIIGYFAAVRYNINPYHFVGEVVDEFNGVKVFYNGGINNVSGRLLTPDGYNLGIKYQCVEFVKRYYYERFKHKMPDALGHAKSFFDEKIEDGAINQHRMLIQYKNGGRIPPAPEDILVFGPWLLNPYGHVAIVTKTTDSTIEIVQQNPGPFGSPREVLPMEHHDGAWRVGNTRVLGWLRKKSNIFVYETAVDSP